MTNHHDYDAQVCRALDRDERCRLFNTAIRLQATTNNHDDTTLDNDNRGEHEDADNIVSENVLRDIWSTNRQSTNFFKVAHQASNNLPPHTIVSGSSAIHLNVEPVHRRQPIDAVAEQFGLPDLRAALADYVKRERRPSQKKFHTFGARQPAVDTNLPFSDLQIWHKVRIQQKSYHDPSELGSVFTVNAHPPDADPTWKFGRYDAAILQVDQAHQWPLSGLTGMLLFFRRKLS